MSQTSFAVPLAIQLRAVCQPWHRDAYKVLAPFIPWHKRFRLRAKSLADYEARIKYYFTFTAEALIAYLSEHSQTCTDLLLDCYDKRYTPSAFIEQWRNGSYRVGWVNRDGEPRITQIRVFPTLVEAAADYVLFSWGLPRLTKEQSAWIELDHY